MQAVQVLHIPLVHNIQVLIQVLDPHTPIQILDTQPPTHKVHTQPLHPHTLIQMLDIQLAPHKAIQVQGLHTPIQILGTQLPTHKAHTQPLDLPIHTQILMPGIQLTTHKAIQVQDLRTLIKTLGTQLPIHKVHTQVLDQVNMEPILAQDPPTPIQVCHTLDTYKEAPHIHKQDLHTLIQVLHIPIQLLHTHMLPILMHHTLVPVLRTRPIRILIQELRTQDLRTPIHSIVDTLHSKINIRQDTHQGITLHRQLKAMVFTRHLLEHMVEPTNQRIPLQLQRNILVVI